MTPAARHQAAIDILDYHLAGAPAEKALTHWARNHRFAGSKDRAAIRDIVFDILRKKQSSSVAGGGETGRTLVLGWLNLTGQNPNNFFTSDKFAPAELTSEEIAKQTTPGEQDVWDLPAWLIARFEKSLGHENALAAASALRERAPVFLRVNRLKTDVSSAMAALAKDGIETRQSPIAPNALEVLSNARRVGQNECYQTGLVELQDAASQAIVDSIPLYKGNKVLDFCAGGGGKALAIASKINAPVEIHDINHARMKDAPIRAKRAGATLRVKHHPKGPYDVVLCDVPCSGSGTWRRSPEAKWALEQDDLLSLIKTQLQILKTCSGMVSPGGILAYATCSVLSEENEEIVNRFSQDETCWEIIHKKQHIPDENGDGFFICILKKR